MSMMVVLKAVSKRVMQSGNITADRISLRGRDKPEILSKSRENAAEIYEELSFLLKRSIFSEISNEKVLKENIKNIFIAQNVLQNADIDISISRNTENPLYRLTSIQFYVLKALAAIRNHLKPGYMDDNPIKREFYIRRIGFLLEEAFENLCHSDEDKIYIY